MTLPARKSPGPVSPRLAERHENSLLSLFELSHQLGTSRDPFAMAQLVALNAIGHFGSRRVAVWGFPEDGGGRAASLAAYGLGEAEAPTLGESLRGAPASPAAESGRSSVLVLPGAVSRSGLAVAVAVAAHDRRLGVLALGERLSGEPYGELDLEYLDAAARMLGVALDNALLFHHMAEANRRLRRANEELTESDRLKVEFVSNVNHELRTPVSVVLGFLGILETSSGLNDFQRDAVGRMMTQAQKLSRIVQDLLEYSSLSAGTTTVERRPVDVETLVTRYAAERRPGVLGGLRTLEVELGAPGEALADARVIERALDALVDNAIKFTPPGSRIVLRTGPAEYEGRPGVRIEVEDNGPGVPPEILPRLFDAFRQGDGSSTRVVGGLGLGLALAKRLAGSVGGRLEAESEPGNGATFRLLLAGA